jgi:hypothetical protein
MPPVPVPSSGSMDEGGVPTLAAQADDMAKDQVEDQPREREPDEHQE